MCVDPFQVFGCPKINGNYLWLKCLRFWWSKGQSFILSLSCLSIMKQKHLKDPGVTVPIDVYVFYTLCYLSTIEPVQWKYFNCKIIYCRPTFCASVDYQSLYCPRYVVAFWIHTWYERGPLCVNMTNKINRQTTVKDLTVLDCVHIPPLGISVVPIDGPLIIIGQYTPWTCDWPIKMKFVDHMTLPLSSILQE